MFTVGCDIDGVILHHAVPSRETVNAAYYCTFLHHDTGENDASWYRTPSFFMIKATHIILYFLIIMLYLFQIMLYFKFYNILNNEL